MATMSMVVRKIEAGSFRPDSRSSVAATRSGSRIRAPRSNVETTAASVGASTEAMSIPPSHLTPASSTITAPPMPVVIRTPSVASARPGQPPSRTTSREVAEAVREQDHRQRHAAHHVGRAEVR